MASLIGASNFEVFAIWAVLGISLVGLGYALLLRKQVMQQDKGNEKMQEVWNAIKQGADAYLGRQLKTILPLIIVLTFGLFLSVYIVEPTREAMERFKDYSPDQVKVIIGI